MTDKEYRQQRRRIQSLIKKWVQPLGLRWWSINFEYEREDKHSGGSAYAPMDVGGYWETVMDTRCDPNYLKATITVYCRVIKDMNDDDLELSFLHELMHIFVSPMHTQKTAKEEELVATKLAQAVLWSRKEASERAA